MNIIEQQREQVIQNNNTAQTQLLSFLDNFSRQETTLYIQQSLHGDIDLSPLNTLGFGLINTIQFSKGEITSIQNIPKTVFSLNCQDNLLKTIDNLPSSLTYINLSGNVLDSINVSNLNKLQTLILSNNKLTSIENLPSSLTELICDFNLLEQIDLQNLVNLTKLNISNNKITLVENMKDNIELIMENNPGIIFRNSDMSNLHSGSIDDNINDTNYTDALYKYFQMKDAYEKKIHNHKKIIYNREPNKKLAKQLIQKYNPKCIKCDRPVGTIFSKNDSYKAICGDTRNPCNLNIEIFTGTLPNLIPIFLDIAKEYFNDVQDIIIKQKLDTLFEYISEEDAIQSFTIQTKKYIEEDKLYKTYLEKYNEIHNNPIKKQKIQQKLEDMFSLIEQNKKLIDEYKQTNNKDLLKDAVDLQYTKIKPTVDLLRSLKHEIMEINSVDTNKTFPINTLFQRPISLHNLGINNIGESPRVISFTI